MTWLLLIATHAFAILWIGCYAYGFDIDPWR